MLGGSDCLDIIGAIDNELLTKGDTQVSWNHSKVEQLSRHPQQPQRLAAVPDLVTPFVVCMLQGVRLPLHYTLYCVECWEVHERMAATQINQVLSGAGSTLKGDCGRQSRLPIM